MRIVWEWFERKGIKRIWVETAIFIMLICINILMLFVRGTMYKFEDRMLKQCEEAYEEGKADSQDEILKLKVELEQERQANRNTVVRDADAETVARVLYGYRYYNLSDNAKNAIIDVILNRVACTYGEFGDTIYAVCSKESQWIGYSDDSDYLLSDYELAYKRLYEDSARTVPESCYWVAAEDGAVRVRTEFTVTKRTNEWRVE